MHLAVRYISIAVFFWTGLTPSPSIAEPAPVSFDTLVQSAMQAQSSGDWRTAASRWEAAYSSLVVQDRDSEKTAIVAYEYGRSLGVICKFEQSEQKLLEALALDQSLNGPVVMSLSELARLNLDWGRYAEAVSYFERAVDALDSMNAASRDPEGFGDFLEEYALALESSGRSDEARQSAERAGKLKMRHSHSHGADTRTPYGTQCQDQLGRTMSRITMATRIL